MTSDLQLLPAQRGRHTKGWRAGRAAVGFSREKGLGEKNPARPRPSSGNTEPRIFNGGGKATPRSDCPLSARLHRPGCLTSSPQRPPAGPRRRRRWRTCRCLCKPRTAAAPTPPTGPPPPRPGPPSSRIHRDLSYWRKVPSCPRSSLTRSPCFPTSWAGEAHLLPVPSPPP